MFKSKSFDLDIVQEGMSVIVSGRASYIQQWNISDIL